MEADNKKRTKKKLGSYPSVSVVFSITLALTVLGLTALLLIHSQNLSRKIQENIEVQVFLERSVTEAQRIRILQTLASEPFVLSDEEGPVIEFISRDQAAQEFIDATGEDFSSFLGENPLRDMIRVNIRPDFQDADSLVKIKSSIESGSGVYEVTYMENLVNSINRNLTKLSLLLLGFGVVLVLVVAVLINNTIKLALFSQRFLIRSMQLVGATARFIKTPFLQRAVGYGLLAALLSSLLLFLGLNFTYNKIDGLRELTTTNELLTIFASLAGVGIVLAFFSTLRAVNKYLGMSLDDLY